MFYLDNGFQQVLSFGRHQVADPIRVEAHLGTNWTRLGGIVGTGQRLVPELRLLKKDSWNRL